MHHLLEFLYVNIVVCAVFAGQALAWNERGHDLIARAAARLAVTRSKDDPSIRALYGAKEHMLGHLANVPDIVWRSLGKETDALNSPTHYIDLDYLMLQPILPDFPKTTAESLARMRTLCAKKRTGYVCPKQPITNASAAGTAPWRVQQLFLRATQQLKAGQVDDMLVSAGLMAHFVGDLANPHHTTRDYDGYELGQGGIHAYFEEDIVSSFGFDLDQDVLTAALNERPFDRLEAADNAQSIAAALAINSYHRLAALNAIDRRYAVISPSSEEKGLRLKAKRKEPAQVNAAFRPLVMERLALAADTLAHLWLKLWQLAGRPNLAEFRSYTYRVAPEFIPPDY